MVNILLWVLLGVVIGWKVKQPAWAVSVENKLKSFVDFKKK